MAGGGGRGGGRGGETRAIMNMTYGGHPGESAALRELAEREARAAGGCGARARRGRRGATPRHLRPRRRLQLLLEQEPPDRRGRDVGHRRRGPGRARPSAAIPRDDDPDLGSPPRACERLRRDRARFQLQDRRAARDPRDRPVGQARRRQPHAGRGCGALPRTLRAGRRASRRRTRRRRGASRPTTSSPRWWTRASIGIRSGRAWPPRESRRACTIRRFTRSAPTGPMSPCR